MSWYLSVFVDGVCVWRVVVVLDSLMLLRANESEVPWGTWVPLPGMNEFVCYGRFLALAIERSGLRDVATFAGWSKI